ncbi:DUF2639 domain-containing protein [Bacillus mesophilus]
MYIIPLQKERGIMMTYTGSKGWFVQQLKAAGVNRHPKGLKKLEVYDTSTLRRLYFNLDK